jgi:hypothetical protein
VAEGNQEQAVHVMAGPHMGGGQQHFPESEETLKGHGRKTRSELRSTKIPAQIDNNYKDNTKATHFPCPLIKQKEAIIRI